MPGDRCVVLCGCLVSVCNERKWRQMNRKVLLDYLVNEIKYARDRQVQHAKNNNRYMAQYNCGAADALTHVFSKIMDDEIAKVSEVKE